MENIAVKEETKVKIQPEQEHTKRFIIERTVYEKFKEFTRRNSYTEWGGVLLGKYDPNGTFTATVAIIPPQNTQNAVYCQFQREFFLALQKLKDALQAEGFEEQYLLDFGCWIHTHPNLSAFLSGTDVSTFSDITKFNSMLTAVVLDPVKKDEVCVNSIPDSEERNGFKSLEIEKILFQYSETEKKLFKSMEKELQKDYYKRVLKASKPMRVFTPEGEFECLMGIMESKYSDLLKKISSNYEKTLVSVNNPHTIEDIKDQLPNIEQITFGTTEYLTSYKITTAGIVYNQMHEKMPHANFIPWNKIKSVTLVNNLTYILDFVFVIKKGLFKNKKANIAFFTQRPNELVSTLTRYAGSIEYEEKKMESEKHSSSSKAKKEISKPEQKEQMNSKELEAESKDMKETNKN